MRSGFIGWLAWLLLMLGLAWLGTVPSRSSEPSEPLPPHTYRAQVMEIAADQASLKVIRLVPPGQRQSILLTVPGKSEADRALRALLKSSTSPGDLVTLTEATAQEPRALAKLDIQVREVPVWQRWLTLAIATLLLLLFAKVSLGGDLAGLIRGLDGRASDSKFQIAVWFGVVIVAYLSTLWLRFCYSGNLLLGGVGIPTNLLALSGLSALSFAGAKAITQGKQNALAEAGRTAALKQPANRPQRATDLVLDDAGNPDIGDFQMLLITLIAAITYIVQLFMFLGILAMRAKIEIPDVDSTLLAAFGLGQGAYLAKKAMSGPKPSDPPAAGAARAPDAPPDGGAAGLMGVQGEPEGTANIIRLGVES